MTQSLTKEFRMLSAAHRRHLLALFWRRRRSTRSESKTRRMLSLWRSWSVWEYLETRTRATTKWYSIAAFGEIFARFRELEHLLSYVAGCGVANSASVSEILSGFWIGTQTTSSRWGVSYPECKGNAQLQSSQSERLRICQQSHAPSD